MSRTCNKCKGSGIDTTQKTFQWCTCKVGKTRKEENENKKAQRK